MAGCPIFRCRKEIGLEGIIDRVNESGNSGAEYRAVAILSDGNQSMEIQGIWG